MLFIGSIRGESQMKIVIIGGFLGGGKTTVLNHLLAESLKESLKPAVIMNEFGKMSVDGALVSEDIPLSELTEGVSVAQ